MLKITRSLTRTLLLCAYALLAVPYVHATTGYTVVSSAHLQDAAGNPVSNATIQFAPVNQAGVPVSFKTASGATVAYPVSAQVYGGSFTVTLADTTLTSPANICYSVTLTNRLNGMLIPMPGYSCIQPSGATWSLDAYTPFAVSLGIVATGGGVTFPAGVLAGAGSTSAPTVATSSQMQTAIGSGVYDAANAAATALASAEAYSANASNISSGTLPHAQLPPLVSADIPNNAANTTGNAATATTAAALTGNIPESQVTGLVTGLALLAPLASPTFTGVVTAPSVVTSAINASAGNSSSVQLAVGNPANMGHLVYVQTGLGIAGNYSYLGVWQDSTHTYALCQGLPGPTDVTCVGGYWNGMGISGTTYNTNTPIFGVVAPSDPKVPFNIYDNNKVQTAYNTLDDGAGNATAKSLAINGGANTVYQCTTAGGLPVGALTTVAANCGASTATSLKID